MSNLWAAKYPIKRLEDIEAIEYKNAYWEDLRFPFTPSAQGINSKPDFDYTNIGLLFPQNSTAEYVVIIIEFVHKMKLGTSISPHIHYVQDSADSPVFKMDYRWYENNSDPTVSFTTVTFDNVLYPYTSGSLLQIATCPDIDGSAITSVSSFLEVKLYRDDNVYTGDALVKEFDIHYQIDAPGSADEFDK